MEKIGWLACVECQKKSVDIPRMSSMSRSFAVNQSEKKDAVFSRNPWNQSICLGDKLSTQEGLKLNWLSVVLFPWPPKENQHAFSLNKLFRHFCVPTPTHLNPDSLLDSLVDQPGVHPLVAVRNNSSKPLRILVEVCPLG